MGGGWRPINCGCGAIPTTTCAGWATAIGCAGCMGCATAMGCAMGCATASAMPWFCGICACAICARALMRACW